MINEPNQCQGILYMIQSGDTFFNIARRYNITVQSLVNANPQISDPSRITPGHIICIPIPPVLGCPGQIYTVRPGDTLGIIGQRFGVTVQQILTVNPQITNPNIFFAGQQICIPTSPPQVRDCAIVLSLSGAAVPALPAIAGGVVLIQRTDEGNYALTFVATGLPTPESIGNFNAYIGTININGQQFSAILSVSAPFEQEPTWAGTRVIPDNPFAATGSAVTIAPFNIQTGIGTNPILGGLVVNCRS